jgi:hypothetical protein
MSGYNVISGRDMSGHVRTDYGRLGEFGSVEDWLCHVRSG